MKKLLIALVVLIALLIAGVVVGPGLIDWNSYKGEITARVKEATGLTINIDGDIELAVLPSPALVVNKVRLGNVAGAASPEMVRLKSLQVRVALGPLLSGQVQVQTIRLVEPIIEIERFSDGRWNVLGLLGDGIEEKAAASSEPSSRETT
ncbi:MAG TPA: AsmA family protein, partial [Rhodospirillales bacterium]|nr:AsmA family protein [Rhodospirillales bacterium]